MPEVRTRPRAPYREDLLREVGFTPVRAQDDQREDDGQTIDGYGAVFGQPTRIDSWEGAFDEEIAKGAFRKSLRERTPVMQYDHGRHPLIGTIPLGRWDVAEEDDHGLHVVGRLSDNWLVEPVRDAIRGPDGAGGGITGMSFRFSIVREKWTDAQGKTVKDDDLMDLLWYGAGDRGPLLRTLQEVKVSEVGPVAWPAYEQTSVGVRGIAPVVVDLGQLDLRTQAARRLLARAVMAADLAAPRVLDPRERATPQTSAGTVPAASTTEPQATAGTAGEHPTGPRSTDAAAGEHSSGPPARIDRAAIAARIHATATTMRK